MGASRIALVVKNPPASAGDVRVEGSILGSGKFPWRKAWQPTSVFLPGESPWTEEHHGLQSIASKRVCTTEVIEHEHTFLNQCEKMHHHTVPCDCWSFKIMTHCMPLF